MQISMRLKAAPSGTGMVMSGTATAAGLRFYYGSFAAGGDEEGDPPASSPVLGIGPYTSEYASVPFGPIDGAAPSATELSGDEVILSIIAATATNDIIIPGSVTYIVNAPIAIPSGKTVRAATGTSVTVKCGTAYAGHVFTMTTCVGSGLKNITIDGHIATRSAREAQADAGIMITGGSGNTVEHVEFRDLPSYGIWEYNCKGVNFIHNDFQDTFFPVRIDGNSLTAGGSIIHNNFYNTSAFKSIQSLELVNTEGMSIMHNVFEGAGRMEPTSHGFEGTWGNSIYVFRSSNYTVENNTCEKSYWSSCVVGQGSVNVTVQFNAFTSGNHSGSTGGKQAFWFEQTGASKLSLLRNIFTGGISLGDSGGDSATVADNIIKSETVGIDVNAGCSHAQIYRNVFSRDAAVARAGVNGAFLWNKTAMPIDVKFIANTFNGYDKGIFCNNDAGIGAVHGITAVGNTFSACSVSISIAPSANLTTCTLQGFNAGAGSATAGDITLANHVNQFVHAGFWDEAYWLEANPWGAAGLTLGSYSSAAGSAYELQVGTTRVIGTSGEVAAKLKWKFPNGSAGASEIKAYPAILRGAKPGYFNTFSTPGGLGIILTDGTTATSAPSGTTPGSMFPLALPITGGLNSTQNYSHVAAPTGEGHLAFDIWLQNAPGQISGFSAPPITHEIMIPLNNWGGYGVHPTGRNPAWYNHDATIDGRLWHVYWAPDFNGSWKFIVFQPDSTSIQPATLNLQSFINYGLSQSDATQPSGRWIASGMYCVSVELGIEPKNGTGEVLIRNYRLYED